MQYDIANRHFLVCWLLAKMTPPQSADPANQFLSPLFQFIAENRLSCQVVHWYISCPESHLGCPRVWGGGLCKGTDQSSKDDQRLDVAILAPRVLQVSSHKGGGVCSVICQQRMSHQSQLAYPSPYKLNEGAGNCNKWTKFRTFTSSSAQHDMTRCEQRMLMMRMTGYWLLMELSLRDFVVTLYMSFVAFREFGIRNEKLLFLCFCSLLISEKDALM